MAYVHKEYPKRLHFGDVSVRVLSAEEEAAAHAEHGRKGHGEPKPEKAPASEHAGVDRKALIAKAKAAGVKKANFLSTEDLIKLVG